MDTGNYRLNNGISEFYFVNSTDNVGIIKINPLNGRFNCIDSDRVMENMKEYSNEERAGKFYIDLRDSYFVDSSGFSTLVTICDMLSKKGKPTELVVESEVKEIIERCDYSEHLDVASGIPDNIENSIVALRQKPERI